MKRILFVTAVLFSFDGLANAQSYTYYQPTYYYVYQQPVVVDANAFANWLNAQRAVYGLRAVGVDTNLSAWAQQNSIAQNSRGLGHFIMGPARRQNSAMGNLPMETIGQMWMASPGHRAALLDPTITWIGIATAGAYWTFNAY